MAVRYYCGTCNTSTGWMGRVDAEKACKEHRKHAHLGDRPDGERFVSNAERIKLKNVGWLLATLLTIYIIKHIADFFT